MNAVLYPDLSPMQPMLRGKVRELYDAGDDALLFVASDRISAFDHVLATGIPDKGKVLTQMSIWWFEYLRPIVANHLISVDADRFPAAFKSHADVLRARSMLVKRAEMFPVECVARGYLSGSGWKEYQASGTVCGITLPAGMRESEQLPEPIFTPAAKNHTGHDENISFDAVVKRLGAETAEKLRDLTLAIYTSAADHARSKGVILADTKFEFGIVSGEIILADEVLTPDSSRYWPADEYKPGGPQPSFDKQFVRDYLERIKWNKEAPAPGLPEDVVLATREKYMAAFRMITGLAELAE